MLRIFFLGSLFLFGGCASAPHIRPLAAVPVPEVTGSVLNAEALKQGGTLAFTGFKPGPDAVAGNLTDHLSLALTKGIQEALASQNISLTLWQSTDTDGPTLLLDGYIEQYTRHGHRADVAVDGEVWLHDTGGKVLVFQTSHVIELKKQDPTTGAYDMGKAIGRFIASQTAR